MASKKAAARLGAFASKGQAPQFVELLQSSLATIPFKPLQKALSDELFTDKLQDAESLTFILRCLEAADAPTAVDAKRDGGPDTAAGTGNAEVLGVHVVGVGGRGDGAAAGRGNFQQYAAKAETVERRQLHQKQEGQEQPQQEQQQQLQQQGKQQQQQQQQEEQRQAGATVSRRVLCHLLLELVPPRAAAIAGGAVPAASRAAAAALVQRHLSADGAKLVAKLAAVFGVSLSDLPDPSALTALLQGLLAQPSSQAVAAAARLLMSVGGLASGVDCGAVLGMLVQLGQGQVAERWATKLGREHQVIYVRACLAADRLKPAADAVRSMGLAADFPDVDALYRRRTLERLTSKRLWQVALSFAGTDPAARASLLQEMVAAGEAPLAAEFAAQMGLPPGAVPAVDSAALAAEAAARAEAHLQLGLPAAALVVVDGPAGLAAAAAALAGVEHVGLDVEWRPGRFRGDQPPASLLQVSTPSQVLIFDLIALAGANAVQLDAVLLPLMADRTVLKLGYEVMGDLAKLASSWPCVQAFTDVAPVLDLQPLWLEYQQQERAQGGGAALRGGGLSKLCNVLLGRPLDKSMQMSDWEARPLTQRQLTYAALDAHCLLLLHGRLLEALGRERAAAVAAAHVTSFKRPPTAVAPDGNCAGVTGDVGGGGARGSTARRKRRSRGGGGLGGLGRCAEEGDAPDRQQRRDDDDDGSRGGDGGGGGGVTGGAGGSGGGGGAAVASGAAGTCAGAGEVAGAGATTAGQPGGGSACEHTNAACASSCCDAAASAADARLGAGARSAASRNRAARLRSSSGGDGVSGSASSSRSSSGSTRGGSSGDDGSGRSGGSGGGRRDGVTGLNGTPVAVLAGADAVEASGHHSSSCGFHEPAVRRQAPAAPEPMALSPAPAAPAGLAEPRACPLWALLQRHGLGHALQRHAGSCLAAAAATAGTGVPPTWEGAAQVHPVAKSMALMAGGRPWLVLLDGSHRIDLYKAASLLKLPRSAVRLATRQECCDVFGFPPGTVPPIGHHSQVQTLLDWRLEHLGRAGHSGGSNSSTGACGLGISNLPDGSGRASPDRGSAMSSGSSGSNTATQLLAWGAGMQGTQLLLSFQQVLLLSGGTVADVADVTHAAAEATATASGAQSTRSWDSDRPAAQPPATAAAVPTTAAAAPDAAAAVAVTPAPAPASASMACLATSAGRPRLLLDGMLGRLCRWLRVLGVDAAFLPSAGGGAARLVAAVNRAAAQEGRLFVTRDAKLAVRRDISAALYLLHTDEPPRQLAELTAHFGITFDEAVAMSRCSACNAASFQLLEPKQRAAGMVPAAVLACVDEFWSCRECGKVFWMGPKSYRALGHVHRLLAAQGSSDLQVKALQ